MWLQFAGWLPQSEVVVWCDASSHSPEASKTSLLTKLYAKYKKLYDTAGLADKNRREANNMVCCTNYSPAVKHFRVTLRIFKSAEKLLLQHRSNVS